MYPYPNGPFGNMMPYSDFHGMNLDWVIQIAKDFLDQYTHIQDLITQGIADIDEETAEKIQELDAKATTLQNALDAWYTQHSQDIADELTQALSDFSTQAAAIAAQVIATIPEDYTALSNTVVANGYGLTAAINVNPDNVISYNMDTHILTIPSGGYVMYKGRYHALSAATIDLSGAVTPYAITNLWVTSSYTIIATYASTAPSDTSAEWVGFVRVNSIYIVGVPNSNIQVLDANNNQVNNSYVSPGLVGLANNSGYVVYDYNTKILTIPGAFSVYAGYGRARSETVLQLANILYSEACGIFIKPNGNIYAVDWRMCKAQRPTDQYIGYVFRKQVYLFGVPESQIVVIDTESNNEVYCFGDSITAGVGASNLFHMIWHKFNQGLTFYNYGVGSTGYILTATGSVTAGHGAIGDGSTYVEDGDNNVYAVIDSISDTIPNMVIFSGTNDWIGNYDRTQFTSAVQATLDLALTKTPRILVITPVHRHNDQNANGNGLTLHDYSDIIINECKARGITYVDGFDISSIYTYNSTVKDAFIPDGVHPNDAGHMKIARAFYDKMLEAFAK